MEDKILSNIVWMWSKTLGQQNGSSNVWTKKQSVISIIWFVRLLDLSVWGLYAILYNSLTPSFLNKTVQNILRNFGLQSVISSLGRPQSTKFKRLRKIWVHSLVDYIFISLIRVILFENLQVTDINELNTFALTQMARTKSRINVKKGIKRDSISCRKL